MYTQTEIDDFTVATNCTDEAVIKFYLEKSAGDVAVAINMYYAKKRGNELREIDKKLEERREDKKDS